MGTRSSTFFFDAGDEQPAFAVHRQFDSYPRVGGADLYNFLADHCPTNLNAKALGKLFIKEGNAKNKDGRFPTLEQISYPDLSKNNQEWNYYIKLDGVGSFSVEVYRYTDRILSGPLSALRDMCDANGAKDLKMLPSNKRVGDVTDEVNEWLAPDPNVCESIDLYQRNTWFKDLCKGLAKDPTTSFIGSGDRVMIASIDEVKDGTVWATIEDCIITRRRHVKLSCNMTPELNPENFVAKTALSSALADAQRHLSKLDPQGMSYNSIAGWRDEMRSWLDEIYQLTLAEPK